MALCSSLSLLPPTCVTLRKLTSTSFSSPTLPNLHVILTKSKNSTRFLLNAGFNEFEPDLNEDPIDQFRTNGVSMVYLLYFPSLCNPVVMGFIHFFLCKFQEDFKFGEYDDHHTFYEGEEQKGTFSFFFLF